MGVLWCAAWQFGTSDRPSTHKSISKEEQEYIDKSLEETMGKTTDKVGDWMAGVRLEKW